MKIKYRIKIDSPDHSEMVQEQLFRLGYRWHHHNNQYKHTSMPYLIAKPNEKEIKFAGSSIKSKKFMNGYEYVDITNVYDITVSAVPADLFEL